MNIFKGITRNVFVLGLVSMLTDISSEMIFSILPLFMTNVLGIGAAFLGTIEGIAESTASILKLFSGVWSDKLGKRKIFVVAGYTFSTISKPIFAVSQNFFHVLAARVGDRFGKGLRTSPRDAIIADTVDKKYRGKVFGLERSMDRMGAVLGPIFALLLFSAISYRGIFWISVIPAALAVLLLIFFVKVKEKSDEKSFKSEKQILSFKGLSINLKLFYLISAIFAIGNFSYAFLLLRAQNIGLTITNTILLYLIFNITFMLIAFPSGILSDKIGRRNTIFMGFFLFFLLCMGLAMFASPAIVAVWFIIYGISMAVLDGNQRAFVADLVPSEKRGTALGLFNAIVGIAVLPASIIAGFLWQFVNPQAPFFVAAGISLVASIGLIIFVKR